MNNRGGKKQNQDFQFHKTLSHVDSFLSRDCSSPGVQLHSLPIEIRRKLLVKKMHK